MSDNGREDKNPWTKWYWSDWEADTGLQLCGLKAQGLWMKMLSIMARSKKKGYLLCGDKQMESKDLAKLTGETEGEINTLIGELFDHDVPSKSVDGIVYNRRMVREAELSAIRAEAGHYGGLGISKPKAKRKQTLSIDSSKVPSKDEAASASAYASSDPSSPKEEERKNLVSEVIQYLNEKSGKKFNPKSKVSAQHINARVRDGQNLEEFKRVIDVKVAKWKGDPKMDEFIRPETLFGTKMESYLNEKIISPEESASERTKRLNDETEQRYARIEKAKANV